MAEVVPIPVTCAVIVDHAGRVLLARRPPGKHLAGKWEFAGGKVESGEAPAAALIREIREELGCDIVVTAGLPEFDFDYGTVVIRMFPYVCHLESGSAGPRAHEHTALAWVTLSDLAGYDLAPADWPVVQAYRATLG